MKPIKFPEHNVVYAENQPEYLPLPVLKFPKGEVVSCWKLSFFERLRTLFQGKIWVMSLTFNQPLQPLYLSPDKNNVFSSNPQAGNGKKNG